MQGEIEKFVLRIIDKHLDISVIAEWFKKHSVKK